MPTFSELQAHLRHRFKLLQDQADSFAIGFRLELHPGKTEAQVVHGHHEVHDQESWLHAMVDVCPAEFMDPSVALSRNATLMVGALALREGRCVVHHAWPLHTLVYAEVDRGLQYLALGAATLQQLAHPPPQPAGPDTPEPPSGTLAAEPSDPTAAPPAPRPEPNRHFSD